MASILVETSVGELVRGKGDLLSIPGATTLRECLRLLGELNASALTVAAPEGSLVGADGSSIISGGCFMGILSVRDVIFHLAENLAALEQALDVPISLVIGRSLESKTLIVFKEDALVLEVLEVLSSGVHQALVGKGGSQHNPTHSLLSQTDVVHFLFKNIDQLGPVVSRSIEELGLIDPLLPPLAVPATATMGDTLRLMQHQGGVTAVAVVWDGGDGDGSSGSSEDEDQAVGSSTELQREKMPRWGSHSDHRHGRGWARGGKILGNLSASDLWGLTPAMASEFPTLFVADFLARTTGTGRVRPPVTCRRSAPMGEVIGLVVANDVHRVWVTDECGWLEGVVSLTDIISSVKRNPSGFVLPKDLAA